MLNFCLHFRSTRETIHFYFPSMSAEKTQKLKDFESRKIIFSALSEQISRSLYQKKSWEIHSPKLTRPHSLTQALTHSRWAGRSQMKKSVGHDYLMAFRFYVIDNRMGCDSYHFWSDSDFHAVELLHLHFHRRERTQSIARSAFCVVCFRKFSRKSCFDGRDSAVVTS